MTQVVRPQSLSDVASAMHDTSGSVLLKGAGTKLSWGGRVAEADVVLESTSFSGLVQHNAPDMTAVVRSGTTLLDLQTELAPSGQWLALDPPSSHSGATLGGLLATGDSGPSRHRYGGLRDLVIGATVVLADSTVARSGGQVIKNVAGYDLAKVMYGSMGTLAFVAEISLRLHPRPAASATVVASADAKEAYAATLGLSRAAVEPSAVEWVYTDGDGQLRVRIDGTASHVDSAAERVATLLESAAGCSRTLEAGEAEEAWKRYGAAPGPGDRSHTTFRVSGLPSELPALHDELQAAALPEGIDVTIRSSVALGLHAVTLHGGSSSGHAAVVAKLRSALGRHASVLLQERATDVDLFVDALGPVPTTVDLLRRLKSHFDPENRLGRGRFSPWY